MDLIENQDGYELRSRTYIRRITFWAGVLLFFVILFLIFKDKFFLQFTVIVIAIGLVSLAFDTEAEKIFLTKDGRCIYETNQLFFGKRRRKFKVDKLIVFGIGYGFALKFGIDGPEVRLDDNQREWRKLNKISKFLEIQVTWGSKDLLRGRILPANPPPWWKNVLSSF